MDFSLVSAGHEALPDPKELVEVVLESWGESVSHPVSLTPLRHDAIVLAEDLEMMPDRLVVQREEAREVVRVPGPLMQGPQDARAVHSAARAREEVPEPLVHGGPAPRSRDDVPGRRDHRTPIAELSNITIAIVIQLSQTNHSRPLRRWIHGGFLEFRLIPVLLWSYTAVALGTALALAEGASLDIWRLVAAMGLAGLVQGWVTHSINEIFDWRSGTDRDGRPRALSGGSKVRNLGLLTERDLWLLFVGSSLAVLALGTWVTVAGPAWLGLLIVVGYALGVAYTVPPLATAYRPYLGEWLGGFPGVLLAGLGAYAIQARSLSWSAVALLSAHALVCCGMLVMHHYADVASDLQAQPTKRTSVVALGPPGGKAYATAMAALGASVYAWLALTRQPVLWAGAGLTLLAVVAHLRTDPSDLASVTRHELQVIQLGIAAGLLSAVLLAPTLWPLVLVAIAGYLLHLAVVGPPVELSRAWLPARPTRGRRK